MPNKGDRVRVTFEGEYSHQGGQGSTTSEHATGFHVIETGHDRIGGRQAAVPPNAKFEVVEKAPPPEPPPSRYVLDTAHRVWKGSLFGDKWRCLSPGTTLTWDGTCLRNAVPWRELAPVKKEVLMRDPAAGGLPLKLEPELYQVRGVLTGSTREIEVSARTGGSITIGAAEFSRPTARDLAHRILATVGWD